MQTNASLITKTYYYTHIVNINTNTTQNYSLNDVFSLKNINSVKMQKHELIGFVSLLNKHAHSPINLFNVVTDYSPSFFDFYTSMQMILHEDYSQFSIVDNYFNSVNEQLDAFSEHSKSYCLDATKSAIKYFGFPQENTLNDSSKKGEEHSVRKKTNIKRAFLFATAAAAFATGDIVTPASVVADMFNDKKTNANLNANQNQNQNLSIMSFDAFLTYSRLYCMNTFSLQFALDTNDELTIVGDKISYDYFITFMSYIQDGLVFDKDVVGPSTLKNVWEQLEALKRVASRLDEIVAYELYDKIYDISRARFNPFFKLKTYISSKLADIDRLKNMLDSDFPISKLDLLEQVRLNAATRLINAQIKEEAFKKHADELSNTRSESDQRVTKNTLLNELNSNEFEAYALLHVYGPLKRTTKLITRAIIVLPEGVAVGGLQGIYDFLGSISTIFFGNPVTSTVITIVGLAFIYSSVANILGSIYNFVSWLLFPFLFLKRFVCRLFC